MNAIVSDPLARSFVILVISFAMAVTLHVSLAYEIAKRRSLLHGLSALVVVPLAPWLGYKCNRKILSGAWVLAFAAYLVMWATVAR